MSDNDTTITHLSAREIRQQMLATYKEMQDTGAIYAEESKASWDGEARIETRIAWELLNERLDRLLAALDKTTAAPDGALVPASAGAMKGEVTLNGERFFYEKGTAEHRTFVRALRFGIEHLPASEHAAIKMADAEDLQAIKAMSLANDTTGGYLSSNEFSSDVLRAMQAISPVRQVVRVAPTGGTGLFQPVRTGIQTAVRVRETEDRSLSKSDLAFRLEGIPVHEMMAETIVSRALLADSQYPLDSELADAASRAFALLEGFEFIKGTANGEMQGLDTATLPAANVLACADATNHTVVPDDILKLAYNTLPAQYLAGARLLAHPKVIGALRLAKATGGATYLAGIVDTPYTICGLPFTFMPDMESNATPAAGKAVAYLLNPASYTLTVRESLTVMRLDQPLAEKGQVIYLIFQRSGGQVVLDTAVARLVTA